MIARSRSAKHAKAQEELERQRKLHAELHGRDHVGKAFKTVCDAGCDAHWLETTLLRLRNYPQTRARKDYSSKHRRCMEKIVRDLEAAGNHLTEFERMMFLSDVKQWPTPPDDIPGLLHRIASCLREALSRGKWKKLRNFTGSRRIPYVVDEMTRQTGRAHYRELATLIGAACGRPDYAETNLKMYVSRNGSVDDSNASNPK